MTRLKASFVWVIECAVLVLIWCVLYVANAALFSAYEMNSYANLIFLPAALRVIYPLVFGSSGVMALILGSYFAFPHTAEISLLDAVSLAILSGIAPLLGIYVFKFLFNIRPDLADLRPQYLFILALLCAGSNAIVLKLYLLISGDLVHPFRQIATIFIGDFLGMIIFLSAASFVLAFFMSRRRA